MYPLFGRGAPYIIYADLYRFILSWNGPQVNRLSRISENNLHFSVLFSLLRGESGLASLAERQIDRAGLVIREAFEHLFKIGQFIGGRFSEFPSLTSYRSPYQNRELIGARHGDGRGLFRKPSLLERLQRCAQRVVLALRGDVIVPGDCELLADDRVGEL